MPVQHFRPGTRWLQVFILVCSLNALSGCGLLWKPPGATDESWAEMKEQKRRWLAEKRQADAARAPDDSTQLIGSIGGALVGVGAAGGRNGAQMAALGNAMQFSAANPNASSVEMMGAASSMAAEQKKYPKDCTRKVNVIEDAKKMCDCEGGRSERKTDPRATRLICHLPQNTSWTCSVYTDGSRSQCATK